VSSARGRTAATPAMRHHYDTSESARWCAAATPVARRPASSHCRLKVSSQATTGGLLRRHGVCSRFPLKMESGAGRMSVAFSLAWLRPLLELLQTGVSLHHKARGPCASTKMEPANDRPSPRSVLVQTSTRPSAAPGCQAGFRQRLAMAGPFPFKAKEVVFMQTKHETVLVQRRALQAPEVMLDDAIQARPGRFAPTTQKSPQGGSSTTACNVHALRGDGCRLSLD